MLVLISDKMIKYTLLISFVFLLSSKTEAEPQKIQDQIMGYFKSNHVQNFYNLWEKTRKSFESAVSRYMKESYSFTGSMLNVYMNQDGRPQELCKGYYINDNIVSILFKDLYLREMPQLLLPDIAASLAHNVIRVETRLRKMFIDANYILMRNRSDIIFNGEHDPFKNSPFALQRVLTKGQVTIIAEDCHLIGESVITLTGGTPYVGHTTLRITHCKFFIEIYHPGIPSPPVITPYFSKEQTKQLQDVIVQPVNIDFAAKLEGAVVSLINTTAVFGNDLYDYRRSQKQIFNETRTYVHQLVQQLNKATIKKNQGIIDLPDLEVTWDDGQKDDENDQARIKITSVTVNGLEMAYASMRGGPIQMDGHLIVDEIRFYRLQVRGKMHFENNTMKGVYDFAAELLDVAVSLKILLFKNNSSPHKNVLKEFKVYLWRDLVFTPGNFKNVIFKDMPGDTLVLGYLIQEAPKGIANHLETLLRPIVETDEDEKSGHISVL